MSKKDNIKLTDLISVEVLQRIQDSFSETVGMAALTTEADGKAVTEGSNFTDYCMKYTRCSEVGRSLCEECDRYGAEVTMKTGKFTTYICHSGLVDFSAPIIAEDQMVGCFIGGQVLYEPPDELNIRRIARELDIDEDEYWAAIQKVPVIEKEQINKAAHFLYTLSGVLSDMAYGKFLAMKANTELERAAKMQGDFLANMSHEIRTPMNAVIGFAEMALREEMSESARDYITQIKSSGNSLLTIINDILDYSKIESGKMELVPVEYEPLQLIEDVADIIMTRLIDKDVELLIDVNPDIPTKLFGDTIRIRQILINICNNATKFTEKGYVRLCANYDWVDEENITIRFAVEDTGIGIKPNDLDKIFNSFQQVDSRRNRNVEGTGLGLSICRSLLNMMDGELHVESEYGKGSTFSFTINQPVVDKTPSIKVDKADKIMLGGAFHNVDVERDFVNDARKLGIAATIFENHSDREKNLVDWLDSVPEDYERYLFLDYTYFDPEMYQKMTGEIRVSPVIVVDTFADVRELDKFPELKYIRKPISVLNLGNLLNNKVITHTEYSANSSGDIYDFTAEEVKVLVVDDNIVNLTVAQGLLEPIKADVDLASSGKQAIEMAGKKQYDIIFMDHMMPELDGVDTTRIMRRTMPQYEKTPIIALSANAVGEARELFKTEGMDDFVAKPIEVRVLVDIFRRYAPPEKIHKNNKVMDSTSGSSDNGALVIADLDTEKAIEMLGTKSLYMNILKSYYDAIPTKSEAIRQYYQDKNWPQYAIEVHALKSASRQIGAMELGELAYKLELAGKSEDVPVILEHTDELLDKYVSYSEKLAYLFTKNSTDDADKPEATIDKLKSLFGRMRVAVDDLDMDEMETVVEEMDKFKYNDLWKSKFIALKEAVTSMDVDECINILNEWK